MVENGHFKTSWVQPSPLELLKWHGISSPSIAKFSSRFATPPADVRHPVLSFFHLLEEGIVETRWVEFCLLYLIGTAFFKLVHFYEPPDKRGSTTTPTNAVDTFSFLTRRRFSNPNDCLRASKRPCLKFEGRHSWSRRRLRRADLWQVVALVVWIVAGVIFTTITKLRIRVFVSNDWNQFISDW